MYVIQRAPTRGIRWCQNNLFIFQLVFFRKIVIDKTRSFDLTRAPPGSPTEHASPGGGGVVFPPVSSGNKDRRGTREAVIESSRQDDSNQYLKFS